MERALFVDAFNVRSRDMENRAMKGWRKIAIASLVIIMVILICVQYAFKVPVWDSLSNDKQIMRKYTGSQKMMAKIVLAGVAISLCVGLYIIFEACKWSFECLLYGAHQGQSRVNSSMEQARRMASIDQAYVQTQGVGAEVASRNTQENASVQRAASIAVQKQQDLENAQLRAQALPSNLSTNLAKPTFPSTSPGPGATASTFYPSPIPSQGSAGIESEFEALLRQPPSGAATNSFDQLLQSARP